MLPESALERAHRDNDYKVGGSPVSSASSVGGRGGRSGSLSPGRRDKPSLASLSAAKRMRHLGYTAVSPGGFESPPPPPPITSPPSSAVPARPYSRSRRFEADEAAGRARNRAPDQGKIFRLYSFIKKSLRLNQSRVSHLILKLPPKWL